MAVENVRPDKWSKVSRDGYHIPARSPICNSRRTVLTTYADDSKVVECEGCCSGIYEYREDEEEQ